METIAFRCGLWVGCGLVVDMDGRREVRQSKSIRPGQSTLFGFFPSSSVPEPKNRSRPRAPWRSSYSLNVDTKERVLYQERLYKEAILQSSVTASLSISSTPTIDPPLTCYLYKPTISTMSPHDIRLRFTLRSYALLSAAMAVLSWLSVPRAIILRDGARFKYVNNNTTATAMTFFFWECCMMAVHPMRTDHKVAVIAILILQPYLALHVPYERPTGLIRILCLLQPLYLSIYLITTLRIMLITFAGRRKHARRANCAA
jgi:hypothetical protein